MHRARRGAEVHGITPRAAFQLVVNGAVEPTERVVEPTEQAWRVRARVTGVVDPARAAATRAVDQFADHLIACGLASPETLIGCTAAEVDELRASQHLDALPVQYEEFLLRMGKRAGDLLRGTDLRQPMMVELADELAELVGELGLVLAPGSAIVANHGGYQLYWTEPDGTTHLGEEHKDNPTHTWPSLVDCLRWEADRLLEAREYLHRSQEARLAAGQPTDSRGCR